MSWADSSWKVNEVSSKVMPRLSAEVVEVGRAAA